VEAAPIPAGSTIVTPSRPIQVVVMGVAGSGKSAVADALGRALGVEVIEGDAHHPRANLDRMAAGRPLTDADREPWLRTLAGLLATRHADGRATVLACSALRRRYRDILRSGVPEDAVVFIELDAAPDVVARRLDVRVGHFMPPSLLPSQFDALEPLGSDEAGIRLDASRPLERVVADALAVVESTSAG
jgi:gluconokinase